MFEYRAKKVVSDSPGLVDFAIGLVIFVFNLPDGQVLFWEEIQIQKDCNQSCQSKRVLGLVNDLWASTCCKTDILCTLTVQ